MVAINSVLNRTYHLPISIIFSAMFYRLTTLTYRIGMKQLKQMELRHVRGKGAKGNGCECPKSKVDECKTIFMAHENFLGD